MKLKTENNKENQQNQNLILLEKMNQIYKPQSSPIKKEGRRHKLQISRMK